jgi:hypothetical protein
MTEELYENEYSQTAPAGSLNPKSREYDEIELCNQVDQVIKRMFKLNSDQRTRVQKIFVDALTKSGAMTSKLHEPYLNGGGAPNAAAFNKAQREEVEALFEQQHGFTEEFKAKAFELFFEAVKRGVEDRFNNADPFRSKLADAWISNPRIGGAACGT